jgi:hypothetical protein
MFKFKNGQEVKEKISGFKGVIVGRCDYITGCRQYDVKPTGLGKDKQPQKGQWLDEARLVATGRVIDITKHNPTVKREPTGGPALEGHGRNL